MIAALVRWIALAVAAAALSGCGSETASNPNGADPDPLFYAIFSDDGMVEGWMIGTIHALPDDVQWRTPAIRRAVNEADYLLVEVAGLRERDRIAEIFTLLATSPGQPDLRSRVDPRNRAALDRVLDQTGRASDSFGSTETWAAALILARLSASADPANGVDAALIADFSGRDVRELEGAMGQLRLFDSLPEEEQSDLLEGVVAEIEAMESDPDRLHTAWLAGDETALVEATRSGMMADREIRDALLVNRNQRWMKTIEFALSEPARPLIAVGAAHLVGPEGLVAMVEARGYTVRRVRR